MRLDTSEPRSETVLGVVQETKHQFISLQHTAIVLRGLCGMVCVQMKILPAVECVRRHGGRESPLILPLTGSPRRNILLDVTALEGVLLVRGSHMAPQEMSQTQGSLWLPVWLFGFVFVCLGFAFVFFIATFPACLGCALRPTQSGQSGNLTTKASLQQCSFSAAWAVEDTKWQDLHVWR